MLSDAQIKEIMDDVSGGNPDRYFSYTSTTIELCRAIEAAVREELADAIRLNEEYDAVLRGLAIHVGAGGFNDQPTLIDPMIAEEKIIWGINHILEIEQKRHAKQEPVAWVYYPKGVGEKYVTYTNPASLNLGKQADRIAYIQPLYAAPVVQPDDLKDAARYRMLRNGEYWPAAFYDHDEPEPLRGQELDAAIDAVMAAEKAQK